jgi:hypothetical protein
MWGTSTAFKISGNIIEDGAGSGIDFDQINGRACGGGCGALYDGPNTGGTVSGNIVNRMGHDGLHVIDESAFGAVTNSLEKTVASSNISRGGSAPSSVVDSTGSKAAELWRRARRAQCAACGPPAAAT